MELLFFGLLFVGGFVAAIFFMFFCLAMEDSSNKNARRARGRLKRKNAPVNIQAKDTYIKVGTASEKNNVYRCSHCGSQNVVSTGRAGSTINLRCNSCRKSSFSHSGVSQGSKPHQASTAKGLLNTYIVPNAEKTKGLTVLDCDGINGGKDHTSINKFPKRQVVGQPKPSKSDKKKPQYRSIEEYFNRSKFRSEALLKIQELENKYTMLREFSNKYRHGCIKLFDSPDVPFSLDLHGFIEETANNALLEYVDLMKTYNLPRYSIIYGKGEILSYRTIKTLESIFEKKRFTGELEMLDFPGHVELNFKRDNPRWPVLTLRTH